VSLMYIHPGSNAEVDFLFGPGGDRKRYKRRRGERGQPGRQLASIGERQICRLSMSVVEVQHYMAWSDPPSADIAGRALSDAIATSVAAASAADVRRQCGIPPTPPAHACQVGALLRLQATSTG
jgi:hypothetical protein